MEEIRPLIFDPTQYTEDATVTKSEVIRDFLDNFIQNNKATVTKSQVIQDFLGKIIQNNKDCHLWQIQGIVDSPLGEIQLDELFGCIWVEQHQSSDDSYYGRVWYPLPCGTKWVQVFFNM